MSTTRWKDTRVENIEEAIKSLMAPIPDDEDTSNISRKNWKMKKVFPDNEIITLLEKSVEFNIVNFSYDKITNTGLEKNRVPQTGFIIVYSIENQVNYIINRNTEAKLILRKMLSYNGRNEIDNNSFMIDSDFFLWLINRIYYANNEIDVGEEPSSVLKINAIKGFQGDTEDSQTTVTASGESVMNVISVLSFFLESRQLKKVSIELSYREHLKIDVVIKNGVLGIDLMSYMGKLDSEDMDKKKANLFLLTYLHIVPVLIQEYSTDKENELWNTSCYVAFIKDVAGTIAKKIEEKKSSIEQLNNKEMHKEKA